jgi:hypothetical protein
MVAMDYSPLPRVVERLAIGIDRRLSYYHPKRFDQGRPTRVACSIKNISTRVYVGNIFLLLTVRKIFLQRFIRSDHQDVRSIKLSKMERKGRYDESSDSVETQYARTPHWAGRWCKPAVCRSRLLYEANIVDMR